LSQLSYTAITKAGVQVNVLGGWDRPMAWFFLVIELEQGEDPLWSNLYENDSNIPPQLQVELLELMGIPVPSRWVADLEADQRGERAHHDYGLLRWGQSQSN
jgi:hypothetical protein